MFKTIHRSGCRKNNDTAWNAVHRKSNHYGSVGHILKIENRQWFLRDKEGTSRKYNKHNDQYWMQEICAKHAGRKRQVEENVSDIGTENSGEQSQACDSNQANKRQRQRGGRGRGKGKQSKKPIMYIRNI